jgi:uncharacterized protein (TIGR03083 family)
MAEVADLYEQLRDEISQLVAGLGPGELDRPAPATPGWTIRDIVAHLTGDASCTIGGDFPREFFESFGEAPAVALVNDWTARQLQERRDRPLEDLLQEWKSSSTDLAAMMREEKPWPEGTMPFADRVLLTDITVHQQDIFGALGIERARDALSIKLGLSSYVVGMGWRLAAAGIPPLSFDVGDKSYVAGDGDPAATVRASRFELFRAMSGRRNPDQIRAYQWDGDAEPYIRYFYPYGIRDEALVE